MTNFVPFGRLKPKLINAGIDTAGGWLNDPHSHPFTELFFVKSGGGKLLVDKETYPLKAGDLVILNKDAAHALFFDEADGNEYCYFAVTDLRVADGNILKNKHFCIVPTGQHGQALGGYMYQLVWEAERGLSYDEPIKERLLQIILLFALRLAESDINLAYGKSNAYAEAKEYFDRNFTEIDSLETVCKSLYVNKFYLTHMFKEQTGIPPVKYLINKRMELAEKLLSATDLDVAEIAKRCGYADTPYFCRVFKKHAACTPLQYRYNSKARQ